MGLILVVVAGVELFTGNNLLVMAGVAKHITTARLLRNFAVAYLANLVGAVGLAGMVWLSGHAGMNEGGVGLAAVKIAAGKTAMPFAEAFFKGVLCNILVCLAVWFAMAGHTVTPKILGVVFPITAFVAAGFEHCIANMYFIPLGWLLKSDYTGESTAQLDSLTLGGFTQNLIPVTLGNLVGGAVLVGLVYHVIYRSSEAGKPPEDAD